MQPGSLQQASAHEVALKVDAPLAARSPMHFRFLRSMGKEAMEQFVAVSASPEEGLSETVHDAVPLLC